MRCPYCGNNLEEDSVFCAYCGNKVEMEIKQEVQGEYCPYCGTFNEEDTVFCAGCGRKIDEEEEDGYFLEEETASKSKKAPLIIAAVLIVAVIVAVAGGVFWFLNSGDNSPDAGKEAKTERELDDGNKEEDKEESNMTSDGENGEEERLEEERKEQEKLEQEKLEQERLEQERLEEEKKAAEYIFPQSSDTALTQADLNGLSARDLNYARNEIYARHGRRFKSAELQNYFDSKSWYNGTIEPDEFDRNYSDRISEVEKKNVDLLKEKENSLGGYKVN